jgi:AcrR family transcriptional regulator
MTSASTRNSHHHGNLKKALIEAGMDLLSEGGLEALTLRKCAARAGVSHAAPAHHFDGLKGLLTAIVTKGFRIFTRSMTDHRDAADNTPHARLAGICDGYLDFAQKYEAVVTLMFMNDRIDTEDADFQTASSASYEVLATTCAPFRTGNAGHKGVEILVWSLVQGYADLRRSGMFDPEEVPFTDILPQFDLDRP